MDWLYSLFVGGGIAHTVFTLALVITAGILLGKVKVCGISLGITWILFVGIIAAHFGMGIPAEVRHFIQEFGLILFVFSIGMQVGPGFFASFKHGGLTLVCLASTIVLLGVGVAYVIHLVSGTPIPTMVGILSGAVTNTPGLGAAQQAYADASGVEDPSIALGYAVAYPLGVIGIIFSMIFIRYALRVKFGKEDEALAAISAEHKMAEIVSIECTNKMLSGHDISYVNELINRKFVISRIAHPDGTIVLADSNSIISLGDKVLVVCASEDCEAVTAFIGNRIEMGEKEWDTPDSKLVSRRILITKPEINGKTFEIWDEPDRDGFYVLYAVNNDGEESLYLYDSVEHTYQRMETPKSATTPDKKSASKFDAILEKISDHLIWFVAAAAVIVILLVIFLLVSVVKLHNRNRELDDLYDEYELDDEPQRNPVKPIQPVKAEKKSQFKKRQDDDFEDDYDDFDDDFDDDDYYDDDFDDDYDDEGISDDTRSVDEFDNDDFDSFDDYNIKKEKRKKGDTFEMDFIDLD